MAGKLCAVTFALALLMVSAMQAPSMEKQLGHQSANINAHGELEPANEEAQEEEEAGMKRPARRSPGRNGGRDKAGKKLEDEANNYQKETQQEEEAARKLEDEAAKNLEKDHPKVARKVKESEQRQAKRQKAMILDENGNTEWESPSLSDLDLARSLAEAYKKDVLNQPSGTTVTTGGQNAEGQNVDSRGRHQTYRGRCLQVAPGIPRQCCDLHSYCNIYWKDPFWAAMQRYNMPNMECCQCMFGCAELRRSCTGYVDTTSATCRDFDSIYHAHHRAHQARHHTKDRTNDFIDATGLAQAPETEVLESAGGSGSIIAPGFIEEISEARQKLDAVNSEFERVQLQRDDLQRQVAELESRAIPQTDMGKDLTMQKS